MNCPDQRNRPAADYCQCGHSFAAHCGNFGACGACRCTKFRPVEFRVTLPVIVRSEANSRGATWHAKAKRTKTHRMVAAMHVKTFAGLIELVASGRPIVVTFTRIKAKGQRDYDDDNIQAAFKATRDGVADALGLNDNDKRITWTYAQERAAPPLGRAGIRIEISSGGKGDVRNE